MTVQNEQCLEGAPKQQWLETSGVEKASREAGSTTQRSGTRLQDTAGLEGESGSSRVRLVTANCIAHFLPFF